MPIKLPAPLPTTSEATEAGNIVMLARRGGGAGVSAVVAVAADAVDVMVFVDRPSGNANEEEV